MILSARLSSPATALSAVEEEEELLMFLVLCRTAVVLPINPPKIGLARREFRGADQNLSHNGSSPDVILRLLFANHQSES
jgi:hypothetical protein